VALLSSFLDNVTTILVFVPVTLVVCDTVDLDPVPFVLSEEKTRYLLEKSQYSSSAAG
jgi:Na+/H+ antiporter NhaD/arsenite permease-like protein